MLERFISLFPRPRRAKWVRQLAHFRTVRAEVLEARRLLAIVDWTGAGDGSSWSDAHNWSSYPNLPSPTADVVINAPANVTITHASGADSIHSLLSSNAFTLSGGTLTVSGTVEVDNAFSVSGGRLANATVEPGSRGQGITFTSSAGTLDGVTVDSNLDLAMNNSASVSVVNGLTLNNATIYVGNAAGSTYGYLDFGNTETLGGTGSVVFGKSGSNALDETATASTLTIGPNITIRGSGGTIGASYNNDSIINQGTISADDSGGGSWSYDQGYNNPYYYTANTISPIDTSGVTNPAPQEVYQTARYSYTDFGYALSGLTASTGYTLRLHFADFQATAAGQRVFNVTVNGTQVLKSFDIFAAAGGENKAV